MPNSPAIQIGSKMIGCKYSPFVIAEVGINYNGDVETALQMVDAAAQAGADAVKVQIVDADASYAPDSESYRIFKGLELTPGEWKQVSERARTRGLEMFASFAQPEDMRLLKEYGFGIVKISSSNITNFPLLEAAASTGLPVILSTGMSYLSEVEEAVRFLEKHSSGPVIILHCVSLYPTQPEQVNLWCIDTLARAFPECVIGFSDHTDGSHCAVGAVAFGARVIEKHFTLDREMDGPDQYFSSEPDELAMLVRGVREVHAALGSTAKRPVQEEMPERATMRRKLVAARDLRASEVLTKQMLVGKRSASDGLATSMRDELIGRTLKRDVARNAPVTFDHI